MSPSSVAIDLEDQAATLRRMAAGIRKSDQPLDVPFAGGTRKLDQLTASDLEADAEAFEADAAKLRLLYS